MSVAGRFLIRFTCALVTLLLTVRGIAASQQIVTATLLASLDSGSLAGTQFPVFLSYDARHVSLHGDSWVPLKSFDFTLLGVLFRLTDVFQGGQVILHDGQVKNVMASFQAHVPPHSPVQNITFGFGGEGVIGYLDRSNNFGTGFFELATVTGVLNAASLAFDPGIAPGALVSIFGSGFCSKTVAARSVPLPTTLGGLSANIGGIPAPLLYVSPRQLNVQVPWSVASGAADIVVTTSGATLPALHTFVGPYSPGIFTANSGTGQAIAVNLDGSLVGPEGSVPHVAAHPAKRGDSIIIFATGLGAVSPAIDDGVVPGHGLRNTIARPTVLISGRSAQVTFSGLAPKFVGVNQINVIVPEVAQGVLPLQIELPGIRTTNKVTIAIRNP